MQLTDQKKDLIISVIFCLVVFLFLLLTGTLTSGFHFVDDHEVIKIESELKQSGFLEVALKWAKEDIDNTARFRPLYYFHRVFETWIFGSDFTFWSLYHGLIFCLTMIILYLGMRRMSFNVGESALFAAIALIGPQTAILWRLGPAEILGMLFLSLSFLSIPTNYTSGIYNIRTLIFILFLTLASLTKESFLITIPAMIALKILYEYKIIWSSLRESLKRNKLLIVLALIMSGEIILIKYKVGMINSSVGSGTGALINGSVNTILYFIDEYKYVFIALLFIIIYGFYLKRMLKVPEALPLIFFSLILIPNAALYSRTGMFERYLLPVTMGLGFFIVHYLNKVKTLSTKINSVYLPVILISFAPFIAGIFSDARAFARDGKETGRLLTAISENYRSDKKVLLIVDPVRDYENSVSLKTYLSVKESIDLYGYPLVAQEQSDEYPDYVAGWKSYFMEKQYEDLTSRPGLLIFLDDKMIQEFFKVTNLFLEDYKEIEIGNSGFALFKDNN